MHPVLYIGQMARQLIPHQEQNYGTIPLVPETVVTRREVQETQCHKIEQKKERMEKKKKRCAHWSHGSPHIENSQGGFALSQGSQGKPLAWELKTEAPKLHHNTMETMDAGNHYFFYRPEPVVCSQTQTKCKYSTGNHGSSGRMSPDTFVFAAKWDITRDFTFDCDISFQARRPIKV